MDPRSVSDDVPDIRLTGFSRLEAAVHLLAGLGRGSDVRRFVTDDVAAEVAARLPGARLVSIDCPAAPVIERVAARVPNSVRPVVRRIEVRIALVLGLAGPDMAGEGRPLAARLVYVADGLETGRPELRQTLALTAPLRPV